MGFRKAEHSAPPSQSSVRYLGTGGRKPTARVWFRTLLLGGVGVLFLVAVPLYLLRGPDRSTALAVSASVLPPPLRPPSSVPDPKQVLISAVLDGGGKAEGVALNKPWVDRCQGGPAKTPEACDRLPVLESLLIKTIVDNTQCASDLKKEETVSLAMRVDFRKRQLGLFAGRSGTLRGNRAKQLISCIAQALPKPSWETIPHQNERYVIAIVATYPAK